MVGWRRHSSPATPRVSYQKYTVGKQRRRMVASLRVSGGSGVSMAAATAVSSVGVSMASTSVLIPRTSPVVSPLMTLLMRSAPVTPLSLPSLVLVITEMITPWKRPHQMSLSDEDVRVSKNLVQRSSDQVKSSFGCRGRQPTGQPMVWRFCTPRYTDIHSFNVRRR